jgi:segregation and condensation protein B
MEQQTASEPAPTAHDAPPLPADLHRPLVDAEKLPAAVEAILLSADRPVPAARIAEALRLEEATRPRRKAAAKDGSESAPAPRPAGEKLVKQAVAALNSAYEATGRAFRIETVAGGLRLLTLPEHAPAVAAFHGSRAHAKLSRAAVETLAIIAYKQPMTRAQLEAIRGVACGEVLRSLLERRLITITGRAEELGRPILYGTTKAFLDVFGLATLKDLPSVGELKPTE